MDYHASLDCVPNPNFPFDPPCLSAGLGHQHLLISFLRICLSNPVGSSSRCDLLYYCSIAMKKLISLGFALTGLSVSAFSAQHIVFERNDAVYVANLDGTKEKKIADGIFPAISPDGTRVAFNTVEK